MQGASLLSDSFSDDTLALLEEGLAPIELTRAPDDSTWCYATIGLPTLVVAIVPVAWGM